MRIYQNSAVLELISEIGSVCFSSSFALDDYQFACLVGLAPVVLVGVDLYSICGNCCSDGNTCGIEDLA